MKMGYVPSELFTEDSDEKSIQTSDSGGFPLSAGDVALEIAMMKADELEFSGEASEGNCAIPIIGQSGQDMGRVIIGRAAISKSRRLKESTHENAYPLTDRTNAQ